LDLKVKTGDLEATKITTEINSLRSTFLAQQIPELNQQLRDQYSIAPLNIMKTPDGQFVVTDIGTIIRNMLPLFEHVDMNFNILDRSIFQNQLELQVMSRNAEVMDIYSSTLQAKINNLLPNQKHALYLF
jgi:hypothetical protein